MLWSGWRRRQPDNPAQLCRGNEHRLLHHDWGHNPEAFRKIVPGNAGSIAVQHRIDEKTVIYCRYADRSRPPARAILDPVRLVIMELMLAHRSAFDEADTRRIEEITAPEAPH